jgi:hypothetical protein
MINDLVYSVKHCKLKIYADDTNIYISLPVDEITSIIQLLEEDLRSIDSWMTRNKLQLNVSKTTMMIIAPSSFRDIISDVSVHLNGVVIKRVQFMRILGVLFDENLSWCRHVNKVVSGCNLTLRSLYPIQKILSTNKTYNS